MPRSYHVTPAFLLLAACLAFASAADAHGISAPPPLPIPRWLFMWGAAVAVILSFVALGTLWTRPRLEAAGERRIATFPRVLNPLCGVVGVAAFAFLVYTGFHGSQSPPSNLLPSFVFIAFWVGLVPLSMLFGDVFALFNPWRAIGRGTGWARQRWLSERLPKPLTYPERLGPWPAALGLIAFAWLELVDVNGSNPSRLAIFALGYAGVQLAGQCLVGVDAWSRNGDTFAAYFGLLSRVAPLRWARGTVFVRMPLAGLSELPARSGTVALLAAMIGTTSFDGVLSGPTWNGHILGPLIGRFSDLGLSNTHAVGAAQTTGLLVLPLMIAGLYVFGCWGMRRSVGGTALPAPALSFAHSLVPIAVAYVAAHYLTLLLIQGQALGALVSDPLGRGSDLFGTALWQIDYTWIAPATFAYLQVAVVLVGHITGLTLAHDRALVLLGDWRVANRSQLWTVAIMVGLTLFALWLLLEAR
jgi:hypothetical protein